MILNISVIGKNLYKEGVRMEFRQYTYVLTVAEERSFSRAARKLFIAQPSLSQYIAKIEQQMGVLLFDRSVSPLRLTFAGSLYVDAARRILDLHQQLEQQMDDITQLKRGHLRLGISAFRSAYFLPEVLPEFLRCYPGIEVSLLEGSLQELEEAACRGLSDLSILTLPVDEALFAFEPILREEILIALPQGHPLQTGNEKEKQRESLSLRSLAEEPFILLKTGHKLRQISNELFRQAGFQPRVVLETKSIEAAHHLAAAGMGVTLTLDTLIRSRQSEAQSRFFSIKDAPCFRTLAVAYAKDRYRSEAAQAFVSFLRRRRVPPLEDKGR